MTLLERHCPPAPWLWSCSPPPSTKSAQNIQTVCVTSLYARILSSTIIVLSPFSFNPLPHSLFSALFFGFTPLITDTNSNTRHHRVVKARTDKWLLFRTPSPISAASPRCSLRYALPSNTFRKICGDSTKLTVVMFLVLRRMSPSQRKKDRKKRGNE